MKTIAPDPRVALVIKIGILIFAAFVTLVFFYTDASWRGFAFVLAVSLSALFFIRERIDDERVHSLKLKALSIGFGSGLAFTLWWDWKNNGLIRPITAYDFICITVVTALVLFHFWRWRDGNRSCSG